MKTQEELDAIKIALEPTHKTIYTVEIPVNEDELETRTIFLKKFDRATLAATQKMVSVDSLKAIEVFVKNTYIGGDDLQEILNDLYMLRSLEGVIVDLISVKKASLKKN
jgi:hypothetical protein